MAKATTTKSKKSTKKTLHKTAPKPEAEKLEVSAEETTPPVNNTTPETTPSTTEKPVETTTQTTPAPIAESAASIITNDSDSAQTETNTTETETEPAQTPQTEPAANTETTPEESDNTQSDDEKSFSEELHADDGKSKKLIIIAAVIVVILVSLVASYFFYFKKAKTTSQNPTSSETQTLETFPSPTPQALNKADWTLEVLNGSSKKGAAAALAEKLTSKGYKVVKTGNNEEDVPTSRIFFADSVKDQAGLFIEDIKDELPNPTNGGSLKDSTASARIIIGTQ